MAKKHDDPFLHICALLSSTSKKDKISRNMKRLPARKALLADRALMDENVQVIVSLKAQRNTWAMQPSLDSRSGQTQRWPPIDEAFLTGIVMETYYRRHSLKPFRNEKKVELRHAKGETVVWKGIHQRYEVAR